MEMEFVESSNIIALGYDIATDTMGVTFKGGKTYHYAGVPVETYMEVRTSNSVGRAFLDLIRHDYEGVLQ